MRRYNKRKTSRTSEIVVAAFSHITEEDNNILVAKALRKANLENFLCSATEKEKQIFITSFIKNKKLLDIYLQASEFISFIIDNNVIEDARKLELLRNGHREHLARHFSLVALMILFEDYYVINSICYISPSILYEANGKKVFTSGGEAKKVYDNVYEIFSNIGIKLLPIGFKKWTDLVLKTKDIQKDEKNISNALLQIKNKTWKRNFEFYGRGIRIPLALADDEIPDIFLSYFDPWYVKYITMQIVQKRMFAESKDQTEARKAMANMGNEPVTKIIGRKKESLLGVGDIELFSLGDLTSQTSNNRREIIFPITFDTFLLETLYERAIIRNLGPAFSSNNSNSEGASKNCAHAFVYFLMISQKRDRKVDARMSHYYNSFLEFLNDVVEKHVKKSGEGES